ncbi:MAG: hypothetical protein LBP67_05095 [Bacteroidales bacterium]|jgi:hypothetical protein|nr:hypothetical protein [Bacteroidales bacterium]
MNGICFIEPLFIAVVEKRKTMTRRVVKEQPMSFEGLSGNGFIGNPIGEKGFIKPRYKLGEVLYLKEPYYEIFLDTYYKYDKKDIEELKSDGLEEKMSFPWFWKNKLFMPTSAARYFVKITDVKIEKLQDISEEDCFKEGIDKMLLSPEDASKDIFKYDNYFGFHETAIEAFSYLINHISKKDIWEENPFVWVYEFVLCDKEGIPMCNQCNQKPAVTKYGNLDVCQSCCDRLDREFDEEYR